jgi:hypothetical protein
MPAIPIPLNLLRRALLFPAMVGASASRISPIGAPALSAPEPSFGPHVNSTYLSSGEVAPP